jgi:hypothetical protein
MSVLYFFGKRYYRTISFELGGVIGKLEGEEKIDIPLLEELYLSTSFLL